MKNWQKATLAISLGVLACLVADTVSAKGGGKSGRGGSAGKAIGSVVKGVGKLMDDFNDNGSPQYSSPPTAYAPVTPSPDAKGSDGDRYGNDERKPYIPEKLQEEIDKNPGKPRYSFGSVVACVCGNNVFYTNVICTPCADGQQMIEKTVPTL